MSRSREFCKPTSKAQSPRYIVYATSPLHLVVQTTKWNLSFEKVKRRLVPLPKMTWKRTRVDTRGAPVKNSPHRTPPPRSYVWVGKASKVGLAWFLGKKKQQQTNKQTKRCDMFQVHLNSFHTKALYMSFYSFCPLPHQQCPRFTLITETLFS